MRTQQSRREHFGWKNTFLCKTPSIFCRGAYHLLSQFSTMTTSSIKIVLLYNIEWEKVNKLMIFMLVSRHLRCQCLINHLLQTNRHRYTNIFMKCYFLFGKHFNMNRIYHITFSYHNKILTVRQLLIQRRKTYITSIGPTIVLYESPNNDYLIQCEIFLTMASGHIGVSQKIPTVPLPSNSGNTAVSKYD